MSKFYVHI